MIALQRVRHADSRLVQLCWQSAGNPAVRVHRGYAAFLIEAMSITKRYFTSAFSSLS